MGATSSSSCQPWQCCRSEHSGNQPVDVISDEAQDQFDAGDIGSQNILVSATLDEESQEKKNLVSDALALPTQELQTRQSDFKSTAAHSSAKELPKTNSACQAELPKLQENVELQEAIKIWQDMLAALPADPRADKEETELRKPIDWDVKGTVRFCAEMRLITAFDLARFLSARRGDPTEACKLAQQVALYYAAVRPAELKFQQIAAPVAQGCWRFGGWSACGYPIILSTSKGFSHTTYYSNDEYLRFAGYVVEVIRKARMGPGVHKFILVADTSGFSMGMVRPAALRCLLQLDFVLQELCADRMAAAFLMNTGVFRYGWPFISPFLRPHVRPFLKFENSNDTLLKFIDGSTLEKQYGGTYAGSYPAFSGIWEKDVSSQPAPPFNPSAPDPFSFYQQEAGSK